MRFVLDASVLLATINREAGGDKLVTYLPDSVIAVTTYVEVVTRLLDAGMPFEEADALMSDFALPTVEVTLGLAKRAAEFRTATRPYGLSMGDRICLALAESLDAAAVTADRQWASAGLDVPIELIR